MRFKEDERGSIIVLVALLLPVLIGFLGLALDAGHIMYHKNMLYESTEAAARSAILKSYDHNIWENENRVVLDYDQAMSAARLLLDLNYDKAQIDDLQIKNDNTIVLSTSVTIEYTFMKIFGFHDKTLKNKQIVSGG